MHKAVLKNLAFEARPFLLLAASLPLMVAGWAVGQTVNVDATANQHPISPLIYGVAFAGTSQTPTSQVLSDLNCPIHRSGGNGTSRYNWQVNSSNTAADYYYESIGSGAPGKDGDDFITKSKAGGAQPMLTIPLLDWIAKAGPGHPYLCSYPTSTFPSQQSVDPFQTNCGNGRDPSGNLITNPLADPNTANVPNSVAVQQAWVQHIVNTWKPASQGGLQYYILDNEHSIWFSTHRDVHPNGPGMDEIFQKMRDTAIAIKAVDASAFVEGPEEWGWEAYFFSGKDQQAGNHNDMAAHGNEYYLPWLLDQFHNYETSNHQRLLDIFSVHYYPQGDLHGHSEFSNDDSSVTQQLRNQSTRSLWDPSYVDQSWIQQTGLGNVMLIPRLKTWVTQHYPGIKTAITEYNWGDESRMNGATAQADIYGIFGRENLDIGVRWTTPAPGTPAYNAMKMYRNYDGSKSTFGDTSVSTTVPNPDHVSAFSAVRKSDGALTVMLVNKDAGTSPSVSVNLAHFQASGVAHVWQLTGSPGSSTNSINHLSDINVSSNTISLALPAQSVTLLIVPAVPANADFTVAVSNSPQTVLAKQTTTFSGTLTAVNGYSSQVTVSCGSGAPATCTPTTVTPTAGGTAFSISASNPTGGDFTFNLVATGSDSQATTHQQQVTLHVSDFAVSVSNPTQTVLVGNTATFNGTLTSQNGYNFQVTVSCAAGAPPTCPASSPVTPTAGGAAFSIAASSNTMATYTFNLVGTGSDPNPLAHNSQQLTLNVVNASADLAAGLSRSPSASRVMVGAALAYTATVTNNGPTTTAATLTLTFPVKVHITAVPGCTGSGPVVCTSGSLAQGANASFQISILAPVTHDLKATASVASSTTADPDLSNNTVTDSVRVYLRPMRRGP